MKRMKKQPEAGIYYFGNALQGWTVKVWLVGLTRYVMDRLPDEAAARADAERIQPMYPTLLIIQL